MAGALTFNQGEAQVRGLDLKKTEAGMRPERCSSTNMRVCVVLI